MFTVTLNGKPHQIPENWADLDWSRYVKALTAHKVNPDSKRHTSVISALTGISERYLRAMLDDQRQMIADKVAFYFTDDIPTQELPDWVSEISVSLDTWDQMNQSNMEFNRVKEAELHEFAAAQAICKYYTERNQGGIRRQGKDLNSMKVPEALPYAAFFLSSLLHFRRGSRTCIMMNRMTTRSAQESKDYRRLDGSVHFTLSHRAILSSTMRSYSSQRTRSTRPYSIRKNRPSIRTSYRSTSPLPMNQNQSLTLTNI